MAGYPSMKVAQLRAELKSRGLLQVGLKAELIARLFANDAEQAGPAAPTEAAKQLPLKDMAAFQPTTETIAEASKTKESDAPDKIPNGASENNVATPEAAAVIDALLRGNESLAADTADDGEPVANNGYAVLVEPMNGDASSVQPEISGAVEVGTAKPALQPSFLQEEPVPVVLDVQMSAVSEEEVLDVQMDAFVSEEVVGVQAVALVSEKVVDVQMGAPDSKEVLDVQMGGTDLPAESANGATKSSADPLGNVPFAPADDGPLAPADNAKDAKSVEHLDIDATVPPAITDSPETGFSAIHSSSESKPAPDEPQKRKRHSASPSRFPDHKRARPGDVSRSPDRKRARPGDEYAKHSPSFAPTAPRFPLPSSRETHRADSDAGHSRTIPPSVHPATSALYIDNLMRPLREPEVQAHLENLALPTGSPSARNTEPDIIDFFLNTIRTHAFVVFSSVATASRVRNALHGVVWPDERERKPLWVDFIPPEKVREWKEMEQCIGRGAPRWEVVYDDDRQNGMTVRLELADGRPSGRSRRVNRTSQVLPPPRGLAGVNSIPIGPRSSIPIGPRSSIPTGPRGSVSASASTTDTSESYDISRPINRTRAQPAIKWQPVSDELTQLREDELAKHMVADPYPQHNEGQKNRYTYHGAQLVDRGQENFEGIRPPHREKEVQIQRSGHFDPFDPKLQYVPPEYRRGGRRRRKNNDSGFRRRRGYDSYRT